MPTFTTDDQWTVVRRRRDRRRDRGWAAEGYVHRSPRRSSYPSRTGRMTYAAAVRGEHRSGERHFFHAPQRRWERERPATDRYAAEQGSRRGERGWTAVEDTRRPPRHSSYPSREARRTYAAVVRGEHRSGERRLFHTSQQRWERERPPTDHYAAEQRSRAGERGRTTVEHARRPPQQSSYPSRETRRFHAAAGREEHRSGDPGFLHAPQRHQREQQQPTGRFATGPGNRTGRGRRFEWRPARDNRYVKNTRVIRAGPPINKIPSDDPDFSAKVRVIHRLIKAVHHLKNVTSDNHPPSLNKITNNLKTVIKPAVPTKQTQTRIEENAKNWANTTIMILRQHYTQSVQEEIISLSEFSKQDWEGPFEIAASWARRNLGRRLQPDSLEQARAEIVAKWCDQGPTTATDEEGTTTTTTREPRGCVMRLQQDTIELLNEVTQPNVLITQPTQKPTGTGRMVTISAQVHAPPAPCKTSTTTAATMTDHVTGDWSPFHEEQQQPEREPTPSPPLGPLQPTEPDLETPKDQRVCRFFASLQETTSLKHPRPLSIQTPQPDQVPHAEVLDLTQGESTPTRTERIGAVKVAKPQTASHLGPPRSGLDRLNSCVQTRLQVQTAERSPSLSPSLPSAPASPGQQVRTPTRHPNTYKKLTDWHLHVRDPCLIVGDSNVSKLPPFAADCLQIDSFPGAKWWHAENILQKATTDTTVTSLILSFGINNRSQRDKNVPILELKRVLKAARDKFPEADIYVPEVNFSSTLPQVEQDTLLYMNTFITGLKEHIPALTPDSFSTEDDDVHWSHETAEAMLQHWEKYVNGESP